MPGRRAAVVLAAGLVLGGGTAVAVGLATQQDAPAPVPAAGAGASAAPASPTTAPSPVPTGRAVPGPDAAPSSSPDASPEASPEARAPLPTRVRVPAIDVDSRLLHLGLADDGTVEVPAGDDIDRAAWFDGSPRPGAVGPAVLEGHVDSPNGPSVFYRLSALEPGQKVHVDRRDGSTVTFVVDRVEQYAKDAFPTREVYANTDGPELRLITCGGAWDPAVGHYTDNTVVYAHAA
ncbi:sortase family protein [Isoptericola jiangsuensis]|uniref:Sortase family protein n=1 Tax=Isoptericola jiangsuensis TaxID=548579 RepID=A0A2A9EX13_9MICO|nr:class F sortase [Isoptericola jiangsuensis]PFG43677.1 sortase family protein [Isoptericola jiangsuensis]